MKRYRIYNAVFVSFLFMVGVAEVQAQVDDLDSKSERGAESAVEGRVYPSDPTSLIAIAKKLRCPSCQGLSILESPATVAEEMMQRLRTLHAEGQSEADILAHFSSQYGEFVLLEPQRAFAWWLPLSAVAVLLGLLTLYVRTSNKSRDVHASSGTRVSAQSMGTDSAGGSEATLDKYRALIQQELDRS